MRIMLTTLVCVLSAASFATADSARQLTSHPSTDLPPRWSPGDGLIAFTSERSGNRDICVVPSSGGRARQLKVHLARD